MKRSLTNAAPVVSLLSPSPAASRRAQDFLQRWTGLQRIDARKDTEDALDTLFQSTFLPKTTWDSVALRCPETETVLHWLSLDSSVDKGGSQELLAVQEADSVTGARSELASSIAEIVSVPMIVMNNTLGRPVTAKQILGPQSLPIFEWGSQAAARTATPPLSSGTLKEVAIPFSDDAVYPDGTIVLDKLLHSPLSRPATGLYQFGNGLCLRPVPAALEDRELPPPSLVFSIGDLDELPEESSVLKAKIGYTGFRKGQIMLRHQDIQGLDVRFCENRNFNSMFAEAHESMLAGSLKELQSTHVNGGKDDSDPKTQNADCWVEFRANLSNPSGFVRNRKPRIAKAPDLPYE